MLAEWLSGDRPESVLTSDNSEYLTDPAGVCQPAAGPTPAAYCGPHDDAYVQPVLVGRLTAADTTYALDGRRLGGRSAFLPPGLRGAAGRGRRPP
jgi:hypothetical protein